MIPQKLRAGDSWIWDDDAPALPAEVGGFATSTDGWTQSYAFLGPQTFTLASASAPSGSGFRSTALASDTKNRPAGIYKYDRYVTKGVDRYTISSGHLEILENLAEHEGTFDGRTFARRAMELVETTIEANLDKPMATQESAATRIGYKSWADMLAVRSQLKLEVKSEEQAEALAQGRASGNFIRIRKTLVR